jgi:hypothetical protein
MRLKRFLFLVVVSTLGPGCNLIKYEACNMYTTPVSTANECCNLKQNRRAAEEAWNEEQCKAGPEANYSTDYAHGFKAGYADFLDYGGTGLPPAMPPFRYRLTCYQTPEGHKAIEDYDAGFAHGSSAARASGLRILKVLPSTGDGLPPPDTDLYQVPPGAMPGAGTSVLPPPSTALPTEVTPPNVVTPQGGGRTPSGRR